MSQTPVVELGPISHIGIVVEDCEKAAAWWERVFGVGPFSTETYVLDASTQFKFKGKPAEANEEEKLRGPVRQADHRHDGIGDLDNDPAHDDIDNTDADNLALLELCNKAFFLLVRHCPS